MNDALSTDFTLFKTKTVYCLCVIMTLNAHPCRHRAHVFTVGHAFKDMLERYITGFPFHETPLAQLSQSAVRPSFPNFQLIKQQPKTRTRLQEEKTIRVWHL